MDLSETQREMIASIIEDQLNLSEDLSTFQKQITNLQQALSPFGEYQGEFETLRQCILHPEHYFLRLENVGNKPTNSDIIFECLQTINKKVTKHAEKLRFDYLAAGWDPNQLYDDCQYLDDFANNFKTNPSHIVFDHPLLEFNLINKNYNIEWRFSEFTISGVRYYRPTVIGEVECGDKKFPLKIPLPSFSSVFPSNAAQNDYFNSLRVKAETEAVHQASLFVIDYWNEKFNDKATYKRFFSDLITDKGYWHAVECGNLTLDELASVNVAQELDILLSLGVSDLVQHGIITLDQARKLPESALTLIKHPDYHKMIKEKKISYEELVSFDVERIKFLTYPPILNFIKTGKLPLMYAYKLPIEMKPIFAMTSYRDYFNNYEEKHLKKFNWYSLARLKAPVCKYLSDKKIAELVCNDILSIVEIGLLNDKKYQNITEDRIFELLKTGIITKFDAFYASNCIYRAFDEVPQCIEWLKLSLLNFKDLYSHTWVNTVSEVFAKRLFNVISNRPCQILGRTDTIKILCEEMGVVLSRTAVHEDMIWRLALQNFLPRLKAYVEDCKNLDKTNSDNYSELIANIPESTDLAEIFNVLNSVTKWANENLARLKAYEFVEPQNAGVFSNVFSSFFPPPKKRKLKIPEHSAELENFCSSLQELKLLHNHCLTIEEKHYCARKCVN